MGQRGTEEINFYMTRVKTHFSQNLSANFFKLKSYLVIQNGKKKEVRNNLKMTVLRTLLT